MWMIHFGSFENKIKNGNNATTLFHCATVLPWFGIFALSAISPHVFSLLVNASHHIHVFHLIASLSSHHLSPLPLYLPLLWAWTPTEKMVIILSGTLNPPPFSLPHPPPFTMAAESYEVKIGFDVVIIYLSFVFIYLYVPVVPTFSDWIYLLIFVWIFLYG